MQVTAVTLCLGVLLWVEPASAEKEYPLKVAVHRDVRPLTQKSIEKILAGASDLLKKNRGYKCDVKFTLDGSVETFASAPSLITDAASLEAVHSVPADVKVVQTIKFCKGRYDKDGFIGCAWRPEGRPKTVIVTRLVAVDLRPILWAHEFGHVTGLQHRIDDNSALMTPCPQQLNTDRINRDECRCFLAGPGGCPMPETDLKCPRTQSTFD